MDSYIIENNLVDEYLKDIKKKINKKYYYKETYVGEKILQSDEKNHGDE